MGLVYSTEGGRVRRCPRCGEPLQDGRCDCTRRGARREGDGILRVRRQTAGRRGKVVTTVSGARGSDDELRALARELKQACGSGGSVRDGIIEIQGDQRQKVVERLRALGHAVKLAGG